MGMMETQNEQAKAPQIDVIMPTYNRRKFLPQALAYICKQTFRDWRLLVVNDGGEDVSDLIEACGDRRIVYFDRPHAGKAAQLNFALTQVVAPYVAYMDDDDEVFPEHLEKLYGAAVALSADFVYSDTYLTRLNPAGEVEARTVENTEDITFESIRSRNRVNHKQILHETELIRKTGGYDETLKVLIDYDGIKRMVGAARRVFHLREITGDHFLRMDEATGAYSSISGIWERDPAAAGRSLLSFFGRDPEALAKMYMETLCLQDENARLRRRLDRRPSVRLKRMFSGRKESAAVFHETLPGEDIRWRDLFSGRPDGLFGFADETEPAIAAVNRIAAGRSSAQDRQAMLRPLTFATSTDGLRFSIAERDGAQRFTSPAGEPDRWIMLGARDPLPADFRLSFTYVPYARFREQLQFDFRMKSLGDRLRFLVRGNERLGFSRVTRGSFRPDEFSVPLSFEIGKPVRIGLTSVRGCHSLSVDGRTVLSVKAEDDVGFDGRRAALVFYESDATRPVDFEISDMKLSVPERT